MSRLRDYLSLLKLRVVLLLDATAVGVMIPAAHGHCHRGGGEASAVEKATARETASTCHRWVLHDRSATVYGAASFS